MIHKVSDQNRRLLGEQDGRMERESMNKSAMDSFSQVVVASAKALIAKGSSLTDVAAKFKMEPAFLQQLLGGETKLACDCENETTEPRWDRQHSERVERLPEMKSDLRKAASKKKIELSAEDQSAIEAYNLLHNVKQSGTPNLPNMSSKRILSGRGNDQTDFGGARKQMGYERNNSIFDTEVIARAAKEQTNQDMLRERAAERSTQREDAKKASRYQTIDGESVVDALKDIDQSKANSICSAGAQEAHKYNNKLPMNGISIFDTDEFQRVPEKTAGEKRRDELKQAAAAPKDRSWVHDGAKSVTSSDLVSNFIDSLLNKKG